MTVFRGQKNLGALASIGVATVLTVVVAAQPRVDAGVVANTVDALGDMVAREYFDAAIGARVRNSLRDRRTSGRYDRDTTRESLAQALTRDLLELTRDKHLSVIVSLRPETAEPPAPPRPRCGRPCGFAPVEILPGNIGYVNVSFFFRPEEARESVADAMHTVRDATALVLDMRGNGGGSPGTVALLASYLFTRPDMPLFEIVERSGETIRYATEPALLPDTNGARPVYVLTSARTFSGGEGFPFLLQELKRAVVIGEKTAGAANAGKRYRLNDYFEANISNSLVRTIASGRNWEGTGVTPDIAVAAEDALPTALERAQRDSKPGMRLNLAR